MRSGQGRPTQRNVRAMRPTDPLQLGHSHLWPALYQVPRQVPPQVPPRPRQRRPILRRLLRRRFSNPRPSPIRPRSRYNRGQLPPIKQPRLLQARKKAACFPPSTGCATTRSRPATTRRVRPCRSASRNPRISSPGLFFITSAPFVGLVNARNCRKYFAISNVGPGPLKFVVVKRAIGRPTGHRKAS